MKAFAQLKSFEGRGSMEGWLTRIATNTCLNMLRSAKRRPEVVTADLSDDETEFMETVSSPMGRQELNAEQKVVAADLAEKLLQTLSPDDRLALTLGGWILACAAFLVIGVLTPVDMRYYLAAIPALAIAAGDGAAWAWSKVSSRHRAIWRLTTAAFLAGIVSTAFHNWWNTLG